MSTYEERLSVVNLALRIYEPAIELYQGKRELRMRWDIRYGNPQSDYPARLRNDGLWPAFGKYNFPTGGTGQQSIAQLIRYIRDLTRLPLDTWKYWSSETIKLCDRKVFNLLKDSDYGNPDKTCCVLCGTTDYSKFGVDWWSLGGITGPCCWGGQCRNEGKRS